MKKHKRRQPKNTPKIPQKIGKSRKLIELEKSLTNKSSKKEANKLLHFGMEEQDFRQFIKQYTQEQQENLLKEYYEHKEKGLIYLDQELKDYSKRIVEILASRPHNDVLLYYPVFKLTDYKQSNNVAIAYIKCLLDWTFSGDVKREYKKGTQEALVVAEVFREAELILVDNTAKEIITKSTEVTEKEVIKVKTETKIIKQEVKKGFSQKEIDKALEATRREFKNKFFDESLLNQILESVKSNLK
jgi:hypothetical protein